MNFLKTIESSLKKYKVFSEELKVFRITLNNLMTTIKMKYINDFC